MLVDHPEAMVEKAISGNRVVLVPQFDPREV